VEALELAIKFAAIKDKCSELALPKSVRDHFRARIEYFRQQSLCDFDRRESPLRIAQNWRTFSDEVKATGLLTPFRNDKNFWRDVAVFVGEFRVERVPMGIPPEAKKAKPPFHSWDVHTFFEALVKEAERTAFTSPEEKKIAVLGLRYLYLEAKRGRLNRDKKACKETWLSIWPSLEKAKLLAKYKEATQLKDRLKFFLENKF
jgi:hypothetical protein